MKTNGTSGGRWTRSRDCSIRSTLYSRYLRSLQRVILGDPVDVAVRRPFSSSHSLRFSCGRLR